jgi:hypothetical protein
MAQEITNAEAELTRRYKILSMAFGKQWICQTALGIAFCLGILLTGWLLTELGQWRLDSYRSELVRLKTDCQTERETLETLRQWGVAVQERKEGRFIIGPLNSQGGWTIDTKPAIKLEK